MVTFNEFIPPVAIDGYDGIQQGDAFVAFNFRTDRVRQMLTAFSDDASDDFDSIFESAQDVEEPVLEEKAVNNSSVQILISSFSLLISSS